ncbi:MAG: hypothetical protein AAGG38_06745 [Planctomycetota bacterium]
MSKTLFTGVAGWVRALGLAVLLIVSGGGDTKGQGAGGEDSAASTSLETIVDLRPRWTAGQTARYSFWNRFDKSAEQELGDRSMTLDTTAEAQGELIWTVDRVSPDGTSECTMTLIWMVFDTTPSQGERMVADTRKSATAENGPMHELLSAMTGVELKVEVAADGHIVSVDGLPKIRAKTSQPGFVPSELDFKETASDLASLAFAPSPRGDGGTPPGQTWKAAFTWDHELGAMNHRWKYTLEGVENLGGLPVAVVKGEAKLKLEPDLSDRPPDAPPVNIRLREGWAETQVLFDLTRHEAVGRHSTATERIELTVPLPDGRRLVRTMTDVSTSQILRIGEQ